MKGISVKEFGAADVLTYTELAEPSPKENDVLIKLYAAGINPVETYIRSGTYALKPRLPYTPGSDGAGVIEKVGPNVKNFKVGDRVYTTSLGKRNSGTYAEKVICDQETIFPLPNKLSYAQGAALGTTALTAIQGIHQRGQLQANEFILIHGATGGVGTLAVQLAKMAGGKVIATAGSSAGEELLRELGADFVLNHRQDNYLAEIAAITNDHGVDLIIEMLANVNLQKDLEIIAKRGRIVIIGNRGELKLNPRAIMAKDADVRGLQLPNMTEAEKGENIQRLKVALEAGVAPVIEKTFSLAQASLAHQTIMEQRGSLGKIILEIN